MATGARGVVGFEGHMYGCPGPPSAAVQAFTATLLVDFYKKYFITSKIFYICIFSTLSLATYIFLVYITIFAEFCLLLGCLTVIGVQKCFVYVIFCRFVVTLLIFLVHNFILLPNITVMGTLGHNIIPPNLDVNYVDYDHPADLFKIMKATGSCFNYIAPRIHVKSELHIERWKFHLQGYPNPLLIHFLEFPLGLFSRSQLHSEPYNHALANNFPEDVAHYYKLK